MDLMKLQNLLNECIMIEQGNYLGGKFSVDLAEAQAELDQAKQLLIPVASITLKERIITPQRHTLNKDSKCIKIEKPPFN